MSTNDTANAPTNTSIIRPIWPAPNYIIAGTTTRLGGFSQGAFDRFNLATHVNDHKPDVNKNREKLRILCDEKVSFQWLNQTHSKTVLTIDQPQLTTPDCDASITQQPGIACTVLTADCLPILLCNKTGTQVGAIHAGWRGLAGGIIHNTLEQFRLLLQASHSKSTADSTIYAWLGPAIGPDHFEVGEDVLQAFIQTAISHKPPKPCDITQAIKRCFKPLENQKYLADLYQLASIMLRQSGVHHIYGGGFCTYCEEERFYSYRRSPTTGRMASFIYLQNSVL